MLRLLKGLIYSLFFILVSVTPALATDTVTSPLINYTSYGSPSCDDLTKVELEDGVVANCTSSGTIGLRFKFPDFGIPAHAVVDSITAISKFRHPSTAPGDGGAISPQLFNDSTCTNPSNSGTSVPFNQTQTLTNRTHTISVITPTNLGITASDINSSNYCFDLGLSNGNGALWELDHVKGFVTYHIQNPTINTQNVVASTSAGTVTMDLTGDTGYTSQHNKCEVRVFYNKLSGSSSVPSTMLAQINLDTRYTGNTTQVLGNNQYLGHSYGINDSTWIASGVVLPYFPGVSVDIRTSVNCYLDDGTKVVSKQSISTFYPDWSSDGIATPSALQNSHSVLTPECTSLDLMCHFQNWLKLLFYDFFGIDAFFNTNAFQNIAITADEKVPFAYINELVSLDLSETESASSTPSFTIPLAQGLSHVSPELPDTMEWSDDNNIVSDLTSSIRIVFNILLWLGFIFYFVFVARRVL